MIFLVVIGLFCELVAKETLKRPTKIGTLLLASEMPAPISRASVQQSAVVIATVMVLTVVLIVVAVMEL